jgi:hypothetical protein
MDLVIWSLILVLKYFGRPMVPSFTFRIKIRFKEDISTFRYNFTQIDRKMEVIFPQ